MALFIVAEDDSLVNLDHVDRLMVVAVGKRHVLVAEFPGDKAVDLARFDDESEAHEYKLKIVERASDGPQSQESRPQAVGLPALRFGTPVVNRPGAW